MPYDEDGHRGRTPTWLGGPRNRKVKPDEVEWMRELRDQGRTYRMIAGILGRSHYTVYYHLAEYRERSTAYKRRWRNTPRLHDGGETGPSTREQRTGDSKIREDPAPEINR